MLPDCRWDEWIVNVIILHRTVDVVETATLETSATLWHNDEYYSAEDCDPARRTKPRTNPGDLRVRSLDGRVPIHDSFAGLCVRSGNVVWIDDLEALQEPDSNSPLKDLYRSFGYVAVDSFALPHAEYVFPIRLRAGLSDITWGVLNCEWYRPRDAFGSAIRDSPFQKAGRDVVVDRVVDLLELHGRYLPVVLYEDGLRQQCTHRLSACYQEMFELHKKRTKGSPNEARQYS